MDKKKRSQLEMKKEGFFYVPQWPTMKDAVVKEEPKKKATHKK